MSEAMPSRPRKTRAAPPKNPMTIAVEGSKSTAVGSKRKTRKSDTDPGSQLDHLLTSSKSKLTTTNISDVLSYENFVCLSDVSQALLCRTFPPVAFTTFKPTVDPTHPSIVPHETPPDAMVVDQPREEPNTSSQPEMSPSTLDPAIFTNSFFTSAALTFQDHLYSSWLSTKAKEKVEVFNQRVRDGSLHAEWKDEAWDRDNAPPTRSNRPLGDVDLATLSQRALLNVGDVVAYRRNFAASGTLVEKDLLVQSIHPTSHSINFILQPASVRPLPSSQLTLEPLPPEPPTLVIEGILGTQELQEAILDVDGRVSRAERQQEATQGINRNILVGIAPDFSLNTTSATVSSQTAKCFTVWRWSEEMRNNVELQITQDRGGRELMGTVFYLRCA